MPKKTKPVRPVCEMPSGQRKIDATMNDGSKRLNVTWWYLMFEPIFDKNGQEAPFVVSWVYSGVKI